jgi:hypothetical protein
MTTYPRLAAATADAIQSYRDSIKTYQQYIDGDFTIGLVETVELGNGLRALYPLTREKATEILARELRRYADFLENNIVP